MRAREVDSIQRINKVSRGVRKIFNLVLSGSRKSAPSVKVNSVYMKHKV